MDEKIKKIKKNVGIYLRVSSRERALYGYGLDSQREKDLGYLDLFGYDTSEVNLYVDDGISAKDMNRPELKRLLNDVRESSINMIVIYKLDRLARNVIDVYEIIKILIEYNCNLVAVMDQLDIHSANGRMLVGMLAIIAQWEREVITERTMDGLMAMVHQGKYPIGGVPFGWSKNDNMYLSVDPSTSNIINYLGDMVLQGYTLNDLKRVLLKEFGINKKSDTIKRWLTRDINIGLFRYQEQIYKDIVPPIMNKQKLNKIKKCLAKRASKWDTKKYYYSNLVYCSCGELTVHKVTKKRNKKYYYYECPNCYQRINQDWIMEQTLSEIFVHSKKLKMTELETDLIKRIGKINQKIKKLYSQYLIDEMEDKVYAFTLSKLQKERESFKAKLDSLCIDTKNDFLLLSDQEKNKFIHTYVASVTVDLALQLVINFKYKTIHK